MADGPAARGMYSCSWGVADVPLLHWLNLAQPATHYTLQGSHIGQTPTTLRTPCYT